jgi:hypothetical protein
MGVAWTKPRDNYGMPYLSLRGSEAVTPVFCSYVAKLVMWRRLRFFLQTRCFAVLNAT